MCSRHRIKHEDLNQGTFLTCEAQWGQIIGCVVVHSKPVSSEELGRQLRILAILEWYQVIAPSENKDIRGCSKLYLFFIYGKKRLIRF